MQGGMEQSAVRLRLAFIDPGLRKAPFFLELRNWLPPGIESLYWSKRAIVRRYMRCAGVAMHPARDAAISSCPDIDEAELRRAIGPKELALRPAKALRKARALLAELAAFLDGQRIGAIVLWNGSNLRGALAAYLARQRNIPVIYAEHGYLPGTTQLDLEGVNDASSASRLARAGLARLPFDPALDAMLDADIARFKSGAKMRDLDPSPPPELRRDRFARLASRLGFWLERRALPYVNGRNVPTTPPEKRPERYVVLPFQVRSDSQLVLHSPLYGDDLEGLVRDIDLALARIDPNLRLVAKFHPYELPHVQFGYRDLARRYPRVSFISDVPMRDLLRDATAVVTVNSTAGFEALLFDKPVLAVGRNFYTVPGIVECLARREELEVALRRTLTLRPDPERRRALLRFVRAKLLVTGGYHDFSATSLGCVAARIGDLLALAPATAADLTGADHRGEVVVKAA